MGMRGRRDGIFGLEDGLKGWSTLLEEPGGITTSKICIGLLKNFKDM
jgi:hypothetical protein